MHTLNEDAWVEGRVTTVPLSNNVLMRNMKQTDVIEYEKRKKNTRKMSDSPITELEPPDFNGIFTM